MRKYKQFIAGFVAGALLFGTASVFADTTKSIQVLYRNIKIAINGKTIATDSEPFVYNNRTYIPVRFVAEAFGKEVKYNDTTDTVEITDKITPENPGTPTTSTNSNTSSTQTSIPEPRNSRLKYMTKDGVEYIAIESVLTAFRTNHLVFRTDGYNGSYYDYILNFSKGDFKETTLLSNIPVFAIDYTMWVQYDYYEKNIYPLIIENISN